MNLGTPIYSDTPDRPPGWTLPILKPENDRALMWAKFKAMQAESAAFLAPVYAKVGHQVISKEWVDREAEKQLHQKESI